MGVFYAGTVGQNEFFYKTRLTYNCAHLRSTKESLMFEYFDIYFFIERYDKILKTCISDWDLTLHS